MIDYEAIAKDYRAGRGLEEEGLSAWREAVRPYIEGLLLPVADIGSGAGQFATLFAKWFDVTVVGVEPSDAMREQAMNGLIGERISYVKGDAEHLPLAPASCGAAWLSTVIHHIPDLAAAAQEIRRVLAADAPVLVRSAFPGHTEEISLVRYFPEAASVIETFPSVGQLASTFAEAGFKLVSVETVPQVSAPSLREIRKRVALRADTTLQLISDEAFGRGLARLDAEIAGEAGEAGDGPVVDRLGFVVLR